MDLRILGCSGGIGPGRRTSSYLLDERILIDAGTGVGEIPLEQMCQIRRVFLSHSHLDHVAALPLLVDTVFACLAQPLVVHSQPVTIRALRDHLLNWILWPDFAELPNKERPVLTYEPFEPGERLEVDGYVFQMVVGDHPVPAVGYVVSRDGRTFCYSGDTGPSDALWEGLNALDRLDLLLVECGFPDEQGELGRLAKHFTPSRLAADLEKLRHRPKVALTHFQPGFEDETWLQCRSRIEGFDLIRVEHGQVLRI